MCDVASCGEELSRPPCFLSSGPREPIDGTGAPPHILGMLLLDADNAADYLRATGRIAQDEQVTVQALSGGVSNQVLYVRREEGGADFVLKQARPQLRTPDPWFC